MLYPFVSQLSEPSGFWLSAHDSSYCKRFAGQYSRQPACGPSDINGAVPAVTAPTVPGPGVRIPAMVAL